MNEVRDAVLADLLGLLRTLKYRFITPTPATHARVLARKPIGRDLRDALGWNAPFEPDAIPPYALDLLHTADALERVGHLLKSRLRVSSLGDDLFLNAAFPTTQADAVFFGPDTYRFAAFVAGALPRLGAIERLADIGCGAGAGAAAAMHAAPIGHLVLTDINQAALDLARINLREACAWNPENEIGSIDIRHTSVLEGVDEPIDCIIANPPYIADPLHRAYRDGGDMHGGALSLAWAKEAAAKLVPGGALLLYTGSAIINGEDRLRAALIEALPDFDITIREIDPDVFGEELERDAYADVERIAVLGVVAVKR